MQHSEVVFVGQQELEMLCVPPSHVRSTTFAQLTYPLCQQLLVKAHGLRSATVNPTSIWWFTAYGA
jgi:hypothetical protein